MKSVLVIGLGRFGRHLSRKMAQLGNEVMIVDREESNLTDLLGEVTNAQIGDCTRPEVLGALGVSNFDICFVCIGSDFQSSLEITSLLKELGAKQVVAKAGRDIQAKFLSRNGADIVTYPERDMAERLAVQYSADNVFDYRELTGDTSVAEILPLAAWQGRTVRELDIRGRYAVNILGIKDDNGELNPLPGADHIITAGEHLVVMGKNNKLEELFNLSATGR